VVSYVKVVGACRIEELDIVDVVVTVGDRVLVEVVVTVTGGTVEVTGGTVEVTVVVEVVLELGMVEIPRYPPTTIIAITTTATAI